MSDAMTLDESRYVVDQNPTIRVLDTDHCYRIVREWDRGTRRIQLGYAQALADELNAREAADECP